MADNNKTSYDNLTIIQRPSNCIIIALNVLFPLWQAIKQIIIVYDHQPMVANTKKFLQSLQSL